MLKLVLRVKGIGHIEGDLNGFTSNQLYMKDVSIGKTNIIKQKELVVNRNEIMMFRNLSDINLMDLKITELEELLRIKDLPTISQVKDVHGLKCIAHKQETLKTPKPEEVVEHKTSTPKENKVQKIVNKIDNLDLKENKKEEVKKPTKVEKVIKEEKINNKKEIDDIKLEVVNNKDDSMSMWGSVAGFLTKKNSDGNVVKKPRSITSAFEEVEEKRKEKKDKKLEKKHEFKSREKDYKSNKENKFDRTDKKIDFNKDIRSSDKISITSKANSTGENVEDINNTLAKIMKNTSIKPDLHADLLSIKKHFGTKKQVKAGFESWGDGPEIVNTPFSPKKEHLNTSK